MTTFRPDRDKPPADPFEILGIDDFVHLLFMNAGRDAERADRFEEAIPIFREAARARPGDAVAWYDLGDALLGAGKDVEALEALEKALALRPEFRLARYSHGCALMRLGRRAEAAKEFQIVVAPDSRLRRAQLMLGPSALTNLALCLADGGDVKAGLAALAPAVSAAASILFNEGCLRARLGEFDRAFGVLAGAVAASPEDVEILREAGSVAISAGRLAEAEGWLRHALDLDPGASRAWYDLGISLARRKKPGAMAAFQRAARLEPGYAWAHYDMACLHALAGRKKTAFRDLERAVACGLDAVEHMLKDKDLKELHGDSRWGPLVAGVRANGRKSAGGGKPGSS